MSTALLLFAMLVKTCSGHTQFVVLIVLQQMQTLSIPVKYLSQVLFETTCSDNSYSIYFILFPGIYIYIVSLQDRAPKIAKLPLICGLTMVYGV